MKKYLFFACLFLSQQVLALQCNGCKVLSDETTITPGLKGGLEVLDNGKLSNSLANLSNAFAAAVTNNVTLKKRTHGNVDGYHGFYMQNTGDYAQVYKISYALYCPPGQFTNVKHISVPPGGIVREDARSYIDGYHEWPGNYGIAAITNIEVVQGEQTTSFARMDRILQVTN